MKEFLTESILSIDKSLLDFWNKKKESTQKYALGSPGRDLIYQFMTASDGYINKGKRVRGGLVLAGYRAVSNSEDWHNIVGMASAFELMHSYLLVHDDFMDQDEIRRGTPTFHKSMVAWLTKRINPEETLHLGESLAVCMGDLINSWYVEMAINSGLDDSLKIRALKHLCNVTQITGLGQSQDIYYETQKDLTEVEVLGMSEWKSGEYSIAGPFVLGGILAGATEQQLQAMREYGLKVGVAFQIKDDELGIYGDSEITGKPSGNDIRTGKHTLFKKYAMDLATGDDKIYLEKSFGNRSLTEPEINHVRELIVKVGARDKAMQKAKHLVEQGKKQVALITNDDYWRKVLIQFADYMVEREK